jgi:hypothetical protein
LITPVYRVISIVEREEPPVGAVFLCNSIP